MQVTTNFKLKSIAPEQLFMLSVLIVNGGNYLYNLLLGRLLGPSQFADAAVLITFLLVLSFVAMTFQLATAKFSVVLQSNVLQNFFSKVSISVFNSVEFHSDLIKEDNFATIFH